MLATALPRTRTAFATASLSLLWIGLLLGVSFLATSVKFMAPSLTLPVALDVGRHTFMVFSWVEITAGLGLLALALSLRDTPIVIISVLMAALVALQFFWLLPLLDARVEIILQGGTPSPSRLHLAYIAFDAIKLVLLAFVAGRIYTRIRG